MIDSLLLHPADLTGWMSCGRGPASEAGCRLVELLVPKYHQHYQQNLPN